MSTNGPVGLIAGTSDSTPLKFSVAVDSKAYLQLDDVAVDVLLSEKAALASLSTAARYATTAHEGEVDKAVRPYIDHRQRVGPPAAVPPPETLVDRDESVGMSTEAIGRLMAYAIRGYSFEEYLLSQKIPEAHRAEVAIYYQSTMETQKRAVAVRGAVYPIGDC